MSSWITKLYKTLLNFINDTFIVDLLNKALRGEEYLAKIFSDGTVDKVYEYIYQLSMSIIIVMCIIKGFQIYILWRDGDSTNSPLDMVKGVAMAITVGATFPYFYEYIIDIVILVTNQILTLFNMDLSVSIWKMLEQLGTLTVAFFTGGIAIYGVLFLIFFAIFVYFMIVYIKMGIDIMVLRMGIPFSAISLVNSDGGVFKQYVNTLVKAVISVCLQAILFNISIACILQMDTMLTVYSIAMLVSAIKLPQLLQQFILPSSGGGGMGAVYQTTRVASTIKNMIAK